MTEATRSEQRTVPYQAALRFNAGVGLREILHKSVNERGRRAFGERAISLTGDTLVFSDEERLHDFTDAAINPLTRRKIGSSRIALLDEVGAQSTYTGYEALRLVFTPSQDIQVALAGLHGRMLEQLRDDDRHLASLTRERMRPRLGNLALSLPREFFDGDSERDHANRISQRMAAERLNHGAVFVRDPMLQVSALR